MGVNDSRSKANTKNLISSPEHYIEKLREIISAINKFGTKILFVGLTPVDDEKTLLRNNTQYWNERVTEFNKALIDFCEEHKYPFVEIHKAMQQLDYKSLLPDGLHPGTEGHQWMYEQIKPQVLKLLEEK